MDWERKKFPGHQQAVLGHHLGAGRGRLASVAAGKVSAYSASPFKRRLSGERASHGPRKKFLPVQTGSRTFLGPDGWLEAVPLFWNKCSVLLQLVPREEGLGGEWLSKERLHPALWG